MTPAAGVYEKTKFVYTNNYANMTNINDVKDIVHMKGITVQVKSKKTVTSCWRIYRDQLCQHQQHSQYDQRRWHERHSRYEISKTCYKLLAENEIPILSTSTTLPIWPGPTPLTWKTLSISNLKNLLQAAGGEGAANLPPPSVCSVRKHLQTQR